MINEHEHIKSCEHYEICTYPLYVGKCRSECLKKYRNVDVKAKWLNRANANDFIWVECSNCGFRVENYKAVILDGSDMKFKDVKYKFCPECGKPMEV
jgi:NADH pyrophosphatase NudC (nudix superfamily)